MRGYQQSANIYRPMIHNLNGYFERIFCNVEAVQFLAQGMMEKGLDPNLSTCKFVEK